MAVSLFACLCCLSVCLPVCLTAHMSICVSLCLYALLCVCLFVPSCLSVCLLVCLPVCLPGHLRLHEFRWVEKMLDEISYDIGYVNSRNEKHAHYCVESCWCKKRTHF